MSLYRIEEGEVVDLFSGKRISGGEALWVAYTAAIAEAKKRKEVVE